jgi:tRNA threonylcarbamoyladenosine biosynthesis protein TsaB
VKILAFDTSSSACSVGLLNEGDVNVLHQCAPKKHAQLILPMIHKLLNFYSLTLNQLDAIAYGCGPGSFTGSRIASSVAQALGFAWNLPIIQVSSLATMAQAAYIEHQCSNFLIALDARMGQIYWATYQVNQQKTVDLIGQEWVGRPENIQKEWLPASSNWNALGDGWEKYGDELIARLGFRPQTVRSSQQPTAKALLELAGVKFERDECLTPSQAVPCYLS